MPEDKPFTFRVFDDLVEILDTTGRVVGTVTIYDASSPLSEERTFRWRFDIEGGNSGGGYMPRVGEEA